MEVKPGYKQTEVGILPDDWRIVQLGDHVRITSGESPSLFHFGPNGVPYFKVEQLSNSEKHLCSSSTPYHFEKGKTVAGGSVVFAKRGAAIALNKVRILAQDSFMDTNLMALTPAEDLEAEFLFYRLSHVGLWRFADTTSVPQINNKHVKPLAFPLPEVSEQRAITEALSNVDGLLGGLDRLIAKKRDLKQAAMQQLLTGQTRLPGFHGEWEVKRLDEVADVIDPHPSHRAPDEIANGVPFVGIGDLDESGNVVGTKLRYVDRSILLEHATRYDLNEQLIGLGRVASIGKVVSLMPLHEGYAISPTLGVIRGRTVPRGYLLYALRSKFITAQFTRIMSGSTRSSVGMDVLRKLSVLLPPTSEEQTAIAEVLTAMDAELTALEQQREKTRALKQAMMQELLTGRTRLV